MKAWIAFAIVFFAPVSYILASTLFGWYQKVPWPHYLVALPGLAGLILAIRKKFTYTALALNILGWTLTVGFVWWTLMFSAYQEQSPRFTDGSKLANEVGAITLIDSAGENQSLAPLLNSNQATLLVFYRGHW